MRRYVYSQPIQFVLFAFCVCALRGEMKAGDVLTQHNNNARTGAVLDEKLLTSASVSPAKFGKLWNLYADGQVVAQPLYVSNLAIDTSANPAVPRVTGTFNVVVIATMHNTIYVYDADRENRGPDGRTIPLWARWMGTPRAGSKDIDMWSTNDPEWGILSTPVISDDKKTLYFVAWHNEGGTLLYRLHAINLSNALDKAAPVMVGVASNDASQPCKANSAFNPCLQKQRAGLLLTNNILYISFGGDGNRGAVFAFDAQTLTQKAFWSPTPSPGSNNGGIWMSGQGPAADAAGNVYFMIGNGTFDANTGGNNFGSSFVKLKLDGQGLTVKDYFTPCNQDFLNRADLDVGSAGPNLLPGNRTVSGGKEGVLYVLASDNLGKYRASANAPNCQNGNAIQEVRAFDPVVHNGQTHYGNIHGGPVFWQGPNNTGWIYAWGENGPLKAFQFTGGKLQDTANPKVSGYRPPNGMPGGMLSLSADGSKAGTGIVWAVVPLDGDANQQRGVKGIVLALDAQDVSKTLWTSEQFAQRDRLGLFAKFCTPTIAAGKVFVPTYGDDEALRVYPRDPETHPTQLPRNYQVTVYGLLNAQTVQANIVNQDRNDVAVLSASTRPLTLNTSTCRTIDATSVDCTDALSTAAGAPAFHNVILAANTNVGSCSMVEVRTVGLSGALANASGIGFYSSSVTGGNLAAEDSGRFIPAAQLKSVGTATLQDGQPAILHTFVGVTNCASAGSQTPGRVFKPYMQFENSPDGRTFRNWAMGQNEQIDSVNTQFDRSTTLLRP